MLATAHKVFTKTTALGEILIQKNVLSSVDLETALKKAALTSVRLGAILVSEGYISEEQLAEALSEQHNLPLYKLDNFKKNPEAIARIPSKIAMTFGLLPVEYKNNRLTIAVQDPLDIIAIDRLKKSVSDPIDFVIAPENQLKKLIRVVYANFEIDIEEFGKRLIFNVKKESPKSTSTEFGKLVRFDSAASEGAKVKSGDYSVEALVNNLLEDALNKNVSDIHIEPRVEDVGVRHRVYGALKDVSRLPRELHTWVIARIKVLSELDIAEKRRSQDGSFQYKYGSRLVDFRVSIIPTLHGEKVVLRILNRSMLRCKLDQLGLDTTLVEQIKSKIKLPHGLLLVAGPTGSGKTTTVYSLMNLVATNREKNVVSIEDPIEYQLEGVSQTPVYAKSGLTFASALRSILRQDPDVIILGEIRDQETAEIAMRAALTGHLVISTIHSNTALDAIYRLQDIGVDPFLISSSLTGILSQRLIRELCPSCKTKASSTEKLSRLLEADIDVSEIYEKGSGCENCNETGFSGRKAIHEFVDASESVARAILDRRPKDEILSLLRKEGFKDLKDSGLKKILEGITSVEEVLKHLI